MRIRIIALALMLAVLCALLLPLDLEAVSVRPEMGPDVSPNVSEAPPMVVHRLGAEPLAVLSAASIGAGEQLEELENWNKSGRLPLKNGFSRPLDRPGNVTFSPSLLTMSSGAMSGGVFVNTEEDFAWGARVLVEGSYRLRVHLSTPSLPEGTQIWVFNDTGEVVGPFGKELATGDGLWTPSVAGPTIYVEFAIPHVSLHGLSAGTALFELDEILEVFQLAEGGEPVVVYRQDNSCLQDAACYDNSDLPNLENKKKGFAHMQYVLNSQGYICTGGMMNDTDPSTFIPYFLTANHCISTQTVTNTLETFWDYIASSCFGPPPSLSTLPRTFGGTLLSTSILSDFSLIRLTNSPGGRLYNGWTTVAVPNGTKLYRLSHPNGWPMAYSVTNNDRTPNGTCTNTPTSRFHYEDLHLGGTQGGSSGAPVFTSNGQVVGQLLGECGPNQNGCSTQNYAVDGKFATTYPFISSYLDPDTGPTDPCVEDLQNGVACLFNDRFEFSMTWTGFNFVTQPVVFVKDTHKVAKGYFQGDLQNMTVVVKVTNGCVVNNYHWMWLGGFTAAGWDLTIRDTQTGQTKSYPRQVGGDLPQTVKDDNTFPCG